MGPRAVEEDLLHVDQMLENFMGGNFIKGGTNQVPMADERTGTHKWDGSWLQNFKKSFLHHVSLRTGKETARCWRELPILVAPLYRIL